MTIRSRARSQPLAPHQVQFRLLALAALFLFFFALSLTLAPAARARTWDVELRWFHWLGFAVWLGIFSILHIQVRQRLPEADPFLLPLAAILSGWGMLTIWRLQPAFGLRQMLWLLVSGLVVILGLRFSARLNLLRRYKYLILSAGILLTALTLILGTNPQGGSQRLWLGCCGVYIQPSEPLKLLFLIYLAAYLSDRLYLHSSLFAFIAPTAVITAIALILLVFQRDLGTASIFIFIYTLTIYIASGRKRLLLISLVGLLVAGVAGYQLFDVIRLRVDAWINPWLDPSGRSFQIVQSLMAIANGGVFGRGPGMGSPGLVPVAISDFIYTAIGEETGLVGALALLTLLALMVARGFNTALCASDHFRRILAAGLTTYLGAQAILIIGGNIRLLPLTGVTLPFVSYGGSSLFTSFLALLLLLVISNRAGEEPASLPRPQPFLVTGALFGLGFLALALTTGWWATWRNPALLNRTDNPRRAISDRYVLRGSLLDRAGVPINITTGTPGAYQRTYAYPDLSVVVGYLHASFGQTGLESSLDPYLRGLQGNPASLIWLDHLLYGQPPPGLDVRLSLDLDLQSVADFLLGDHPGAVILMNAASGELIVMASHPGFNANTLDDQHAALLLDPASPLLNRATQNLYPAGGLAGIFLSAAELPENAPVSQQTVLFSKLGFFDEPQIPIPVAIAQPAGAAIRISPLQMALAAATLVNQGWQPAPHLVLAVENPSGGWIILPTLQGSQEIFTASSVQQITERYIVPGTPFWQVSAIQEDTGSSFTWTLAGTLPDWQGGPLVTVVLLEEEYPSLAEYLALNLLRIATNP